MKDLRNIVVKLKPETPLIGGKEIRIEDTCDKVFDSPVWMMDYGNPGVYQFLAAHTFSFFNSGEALECYYGKVGGLGYIVREDELEIQED